MSDGFHRDLHDRNLKNRYRKQWVWIQRQIKIISTLKCFGLSGTWCKDQNQTFLKQITLYNSTVLDWSLVQKMRILYWHRNLIWNIEMSRFKKHFWNFRLFWFCCKNQNHRFSMDSTSVNVMLSIENLMQGMEPLVPEMYFSEISDCRGFQAMIKTFEVSNEFLATSSNTSWNFDGRNQNCCCSKYEFEKQDKSMLLAVCGRFGRSRMQQKQQSNCLLN